MMTFFCASSISNAAFLRLPARPTEYRVHSIYTHSCNIIHDNAVLLTIAHEKVGNLPGGILLKYDNWDAFMSSGLVENESILISQSSLHQYRHNLKVDLKNTPRWEPVLDVEYPCDPTEIPFRLIKALRLSQPCAFGKEILRERCAELLSALVLNLDVGINTGVANLVGLGPGLTPSGDDFLVGILLALYLLRNQHRIFLPVLKSLSRAVEDHAERTTAVGESYLRFAAIGIFAEIVVNFGKQFFSASGIWNQAAERLRDFGCSSGRDLMYGFARTVKIFRHKYRSAGNSDQLRKNEGFQLAAFYDDSNLW